MTFRLTHFAIPDQLLSVLCEVAGFEMDEDMIDPAAFMSAMIASFVGDRSPLVAAIRAMIR
jgi:hypothetical protein